MHADISIRSGRHTNKPMVQCESADMTMTNVRSSEGLTDAVLGDGIASFPELCSEAIAECFATMANRVDHGGRQSAHLRSHRECSARDHETTLMGDWRRPLGTPFGDSCRPGRGDPAELSCPGPRGSCSSPYPGIASPPCRVRPGAGSAGLWVA